MRLYTLLFGRLMKPLDDDTGAGGGAGGEATDRGDNFTATTDDKAAGTSEASEDDVKVATGETGEEDDKGEQPRDEHGKFAKKEDKESQFVPKARFNEAVQREREAREAAERELAEIRRQQQAVSRGADIGKLEEQVRELRAQEHEALITGDKKLAAELTEKADRLNRQIAIEQSRDMSVAAKEAAREEIRWDMTLERIEEQYPALNEKAEEFDQELTDDVVDKMNGYMQRERLPRSEALLKAVKYVMSRQTAPAPEAKDGGKGLDRGKPQERKEAAVSKNLEASKRQPASLDKVGGDTDKSGKQGPAPEVDQMTYEDFNALPETTKAKMRGDYV